MEALSTTYPNLPDKKLRKRSSRNGDGPEEVFALEKAGANWANLIMEAHVIYFLK